MTRRRTKPVATLLCALVLLPATTAHIDPDDPNPPEAQAPSEWDNPTLSLQDVQGHAEHLPRWDLHWTGPNPSTDPPADQSTDPPTLEGEPLPSTGDDLVHQILEQAFHCGTGLYNNNPGPDGAQPVSVEENHIILFVPSEVAILPHSLTPVDLSSFVAVPTGVHVGLCGTPGMRDPNG